MEKQKRLWAWAEAFAGDLNNTFEGVLGSGFPPFEAISKSGGDGRLVVQPVDAAPVRLFIAGEHALNFSVAFHCVRDSSEAFLKVAKADLHVFPEAGGAPLFRYEYVDGLSDRGIPSAHLQLHAHRDEFLFAMLRARKGRPGARTAAATGGKGKVPSLASIHFPVGGTRFRPCVEDVLQLLINELSIDHAESTATATLERGREQWRRRQTRAVVRDAPSEAVAALEGMGYRIVPPDEGPPADNIAVLTRT